MERRSHRSEVPCSPGVLNKRAELPMTLKGVSLHIGRRLAQRRAELKLTLAEVAARCEVSLQQIHRYEIGGNVISAPMLWSLAKCLGVPVSYFFEGLEAEGD